MNKGWKFDSARHSLARKGIETGKKKKTSVEKIAINLWNSYSGNVKNVMQETKEIFDIKDKESIVMTGAKVAISPIRIPWKIGVAYGTAITKKPTARSVKFKDVWGKSAKH